MKNTKIINYLTSLSEKEVRVFNDFILSPYLNKSKLIKALWKYLKPFAPDFDDAKIERTLIIKHLYKEITPTTNKRFNDLAVAFCKLFEQFIMLENLDKNKNYKTRLLVNAFGERRLSKHFYKTIEKEKKPIQKKVVKDVDDYEQLLFLETERYFYPETSKYDVKDDGMQVVLNTIYEYSTILMFKNVVEAKQIQLFVNRNYKFNQLKINENYEGKSVLIQLYKALYELFSTTKEQYDFYQLNFILFENHIEKIKNRQTKIDILNIFINYSSIYYTKNIKYYKAIFNASKLGFDQLLLIEKNYIHGHHFANICVIAGELGYVEWLEQFIDKYLIYVDVKTRDNITLLGKVSLLFAKKEYNNVLDTLSKISIERINENIWFRTIELRCLYELKDSAINYEYLIDSRIENFKRYCHRKKEQSNLNMTAQLNFIKCYSYLVDNSTEKKLSKIQKIIQNNEEAIICRLWLLKKINLL